MTRRYVVTVRQPGHPTTVVSRHFGLAAAHRRAAWLRSQSAYADADVRAGHLTDLEH